MATEERITFAAGNFWGAEASFRNEHDVLATRVGYMGGDVDDPTDEDVANGSTGHAEVVEVTFDAERRSLQFMLEWFWQIHDPTQVARYGPKVGHRHRSAIFCHTHDQEAEAIAWLEAKQAQSCAPLLTEIRRATTFWPAGPDHQQRLERRGAFEAGRLPDDVEPTPYTLSQADDPSAFCRVDLDLAERAGAAFSPHFHGDVLRRIFDCEQRHVDAAANELRRSLPSSPSEADSEPFPVWHSETAMYTWATETRLRWSLDGCEHEFIVNLAPGSHMARPVLPERGRLRSVYLTPALNPADAGHGYSGGSPTQRCGSGFAARPMRGPRQQSSEAAIGTWHEHIPAVEAALDVVDGGEPHRVRWQAGELEFTAHEDRADGERTLRALGADVCPCLYVLDLWHSGWLSQRWYSQPVADLFGLWYPGDPLVQVDDHDHAVVWQPEHWANRFRGLPLAPLPDPKLTRSPHWWPDDHERRAVFARVHTALSHLPQPLKFSWLLGSLDALEQQRHELPRWDRANLQYLSLRPLQGAISCSLWKWCRFEPGIEHGSVTCRLLERDERPQADGHIDGPLATMAVGVPFRWLTHVWARGLAVIDDQLVLDVQGPSESPELAAVVATWETVNGASRLVTREDTASWDGTEWHLTIS